MLFRSHGAHLPITTDSDIVTEIASRLAKKCNFVVLPTVSYGISFEHEPFFQVNIQLLGFLRDIISSLVINKVKSVIILNGHHGNVDTLEMMEANPEREWNLDFKDVKIDFYSYWHFMEHEFDHAGFVETSLMLAISDKVKMKKAKKGLITKGLSEKEIQRINKLSTERGGFPKVAKNGVWGDPTKASGVGREKLISAW